MMELSHEWIKDGGIRALVRMLAGLQKALDEEEELDFRLAYDSGDRIGVRKGFHTFTGDPSFDQYHCDFCVSCIVDEEADCEWLASELFEQIWSEVLSESHRSNPENPKHERHA